MPATNFFDVFLSRSETFGITIKPTGSRRFSVVIQQIVVLVSLASSLCCAAQAQTVKEPWEELGKRVDASENIAPLGNDLFGDRVGLALGDLSFSNTDVSLPGNNALPVAITRTLTANNRRGYRNDSMAADWDIDLPSISGVFAPDWVSGSSGSTNRCTVSSASSASPPNVTKGVLFWPWDFWQGLTLNIPDGGGELLLMNSASPRPTAGGPYYWVTSGLTALSCLDTINNGNGQGFLAITKDGTRYWFNWMAQYYEPQLQKKSEGSSITGTLDRRRNVLYATRVEDRFGNSVTYTYTNSATQPGKLTRILSSDGRQIDIAYNGAGQIANLNDGNRIWTYQYGDVSTSGGTYKTLTAVVLPDQSRWSFDFTQFSQAFIPKPPPDEGSWTCLYPPDLLPVADKVGFVNHPSGAQGRFQIGIERHGYSNVPTTCRSDTSDTADQERMTYVNARPVAFDAFSLKQKQTSGPGLATLTWDYSYTSDIGATQYGTGYNVPVCSGTSCPPPTCTNAGCAGSHYTTIVGPTQTLNYRHGNSYEYNEGKLLSVTVGPPGSAGTLRSEIRTYDLSRTQQAYPPRFGFSPRYFAAGFTSEYFRPQLSTSITQSSTTYTNSVNSFDSLARELSVTRGNSLGSSRTDVTAYQDDMAKWVLGLVTSSTNSDTGLVESATDYNSTSQLPEKTYSFGLLQQSFAYNPDGTLATITDPLNRSTGLSQWKRGAPQRVDFADGTAMTAVVNNQGWVTSRTDERNNQTGYSYDPLGRLASITYPTGDSVAWTNPVYTYVQLTSPELGFPAGSWRSRKVAGSFQRSVYHDAQLRPTLIEERDTATGQNYYVRNAYDAEGQKTFGSYRSTSSAASTGINTQYDALGRLILRQTTDGITLETVSYPAGNRKQTTDADNKTTLIQYQSFDEPDYNRPVKITAPENQNTTIARDRFGKVTSVTQSGPFQRTTLSYTRQYRYDSYQRLCGRFDPESGSTGWGYDLASQMTWEIKGQTATSCVTSIPPTATRYSYDLRGRKARVDYPGIADDVDYGYDAKGNLTSVSNPIAVWTYSYNKRNLLESEQAQIDGRTYALRSVYNSRAQVSSATYPDALNIAYAPDSFGLPTQMLATCCNNGTPLGLFVGGIQHHSNGLVASYNLGNGLSYTQSLDARLRPNLQEIRNGGAAIQKLAYSYSQEGDLTAIDDQLDNADDATLSYDDLHRLTGASGLWGSYSYQYDPVNNLRARTGSNALSYSYDSAKNLLSSISGSSSRSYTHDALGRTTSDGTRSFSWTAADQMSLISNVASYFYDGNGKRIKTVKQNGVVEYAIYSKSGVLAYVDRSDNTHSAYLQLDGKTIVEVTNGGPTYLHPDLLGSPRLATGPSNQQLPIWREHYSPYGEKLNGVSTKVGYTGHAYDAESGLTYAQARFYDPLVGRFLSIDPIGVKDNPFTFNRYGYANNNPYRYIDPTGKESAAVKQPEQKVVKVKNPGSRISTALTITVSPDGKGLSVSGGGILGAQLEAALNGGPRGGGSRSSSGSTNTQSSSGNGSAIANVANTALNNISLEAEAGVAWGAGIKLTAEKGLVGNNDSASISSVKGAGGFFGAMGSTDLINTGNINGPFLGLGVEFGDFAAGGVSFKYGLTPPHNINLSVSGGFGFGFMIEYTNIGFEYNLE
ncbi:RHS repeat domain-containing protein [Nevskia ramosa]|uniref:RHS repeat domain-containing protein n=1 Tax=Nevskia ramosa TaxID=64002 RepID=UPI002355FF2D|nr:RHS repeat-associated core domain-containing protein [Nevskia ramosa]